MKAVILYENPDWLPPLVEALRAEAIPFEARFVHRSCFSLAEKPEAAVYINRMSASSDTRGHGESLVLARHIIDWVEAAGLPVVNGSGALALEVSKVKQYAELARAGFHVPETRVVVGGRSELVQAGNDPTLPFPCVYKYNRGGKGTGVVLLRTREEFLKFASEADIPAGSPDFTHLLQRYITPGRGSYITRAEFVDGKFLYAIEADTSRGFELCPADGCDVGSATGNARPLGASAQGAVCAVDARTDTPAPPGHQALFRLCEAPPAHLIAALESFVRAQGLRIAGIEFIEDAQGTPYVYDINCNTNYSPTVEMRHGLSGMRAVARMVGRLITETSWAESKAQERGARGAP
ncbi:MAG: alpha-L-glutamate ligase [Silvanigrellales bacterium]|jgi:hypothetical protein|nr:alpha-L-glutamate ligase [Silvanigrellales bacterium]